MMHEIGQHVNFGASDAQRVPNEADPQFVREVTPLFRFGAPSDAMTDLIEIGSKVYVKVFRPLLEVIVHEGVTEADIRFIANLLLHANGPLFVNLPKPDDPSYLLQLGHVDEKTRIRDLQAAMTGALAGQTYPVHFVLRADFDVRKSIFLGRWVSQEAIQHMKKHLSYEEVQRTI